MPLTFASSTPRSRPRASSLARYPPKICRPSGTRGSSEFMVSPTGHSPPANSLRPPAHFRRPDQHCKQWPEANKSCLLRPQLLTLWAPLDTRPTPPLPPPAEVLPNSKLQVIGLKSRYSPGDRLELLCQADFSRPAPSLGWLVNGRPVSNFRFRTSHSARRRRHPASKQISLASPS